MGFNKRLIILESVWGGEGYLGADIISFDFNIPLRLVKIYMPCHNTEILWKKLLDADFMQIENLIIGGDLNFSLGLAESWGNKA